MMMPAQLSDLPLLTLDKCAQTAIKGVLIERWPDRLC